jgi:hypothetical protein
VKSQWLRCHLCLAHRIKHKVCIKVRCQKCEVKICDRNCFLDCNIISLSWMLWCLEEGHTLQVCHYLMAGQVKSVKPCLKQLQQSIQTIMQPTWPTDESEYLSQGSFSKYESMVTSDHSPLLKLSYQTPSLEEWCMVYRVVFILTQLVIKVSGLMEPDGPFLYSNKTTIQCCPEPIEFSSHNIFLRSFLILSFCLRLSLA